VRFDSPGEPDSGPIAYCGGVWVSQTDFVTAAHCPDAEEYIAVQTLPDMASRPEGWRAGTILSVDEKDDLALIRVSGWAPTHPVLHFPSAPAWPGEPLHVVGHVVGSRWSYRRAEVSALRPDEMNPGGNLVDSIQISGWVWKGDSGGGAFDDDGALVGIVVYVHQIGPWMSSYLVDWRVVKRFVDSAERDATRPAHDAGH